MFKGLEYFTFLEENHPLIKPLLFYQDGKLLDLWQLNPNQGKYLVAIFCRYNLAVYNLINDSISSALITNLIFTKIWQHIFHQLSTFSLNTQQVLKSDSLSHWLISLTHEAIADYKKIALQTGQSETLTNVDMTKYYQRCLPLEFYLEKALVKLSPLHRLIFVMTEKFAWNSSQVIEYLEKQGETISKVDLEAYLLETYELVEKNLPEDILKIYLK